MPAGSLHATIQQWQNLTSQSGIATELTVYRLSNDPRIDNPNSASREIVRAYEPLDVRAEKLTLDGLIITGANLERESSGKALPFHDITYIHALYEIMDYVRANIPSTYYSCLASHVALDRFYGLPRTIGQRKTFGVFKHRVMAPRSPFVRGIGKTMLAPHSRWGGVLLEQGALPAELTILARNRTIGWLALSAPNRAGGEDLFVQGHPEYDPEALHREYDRDVPQGNGQVPAHYYRGRPDSHNIRHGQPHSQQFIRNWLTYIDQLRRSQSSI